VGRGHAREVEVDGKLEVVGKRAFPFWMRASAFSLLGLSVMALAGWALMQFTFGRNDLDLVVANEPARLPPATGLAQIDRQASAQTTATKSVGDPIVPSAIPAAEVPLEKVAKQRVIERVPPLTPATKTPPLTKPAATQVAQLEPRAAELAALNRSRVESLTSTPSGAPKIEAEPVISKREMDSIVSAFSNHYESGRLEAAMELFDNQNNATHYRKVLGILSDTFANTTSRRLQLGKLNLSAESGNGSAKGDAKVIMTLKRDDSRLERRIGIEFDFVRRNDRVMISELRTTSAQ
jgi:hypothetical protein